ncbi:hypothetical protein KEM56_006182 [Ascosphaera pollenicola]|nr:hypothetical protein KEM56_006182 [Ascosphaera pollenicola]
MLPFVLRMQRGPGEPPNCDHNCAFCAVIHDGCVKHIEVDCGIYGSETMSSSTQWLPALLVYLDSAFKKWDAAKVSRDRATSGLIHKVCPTSRSEVTDLWHSKMIDLRELINLEQVDKNDIRRLYAGIGLTATYCPEPLLPHHSLLLTSYWAILSSSPRNYLKLVCDDDEVASVEHETDIYNYLSKHDPDIAPKFLGHVHKRGYVTGFALEYIEHGYHPRSAADLPSCKAVLQRFHRLGFTHGFVDQYSFIVEDRDGEKKARMINFFHAAKRVVGPLEDVQIFGDDMVEFQQLELLYGVPSETENTEGNH